MVQTTTTTVQSPRTPSRQLGVTRGQRRTPYNHSKKPYDRSSNSNGGNAQFEDSKASRAPGFISGMRNLVSRLWGASIKSASGASDMEAALASARASVTNAPSDSRIQPIQPSVQAATNKSVGEETVSASQHTQAAGDSVRLRHPTAESDFGPSSFAYNKKLATATPLVANLHDAERNRSQSYALSRRHTVGKIEGRRPQPSEAEAQLSSSCNSGEEAGGNPSYVSASSARRLLSTLDAIHTPIRDAQGRTAESVASGQFQVRSTTAPGERTSLVPLRRLPVSMLALTDTQNRPPRSSLAMSADVLDKESFKRGSSQKSIPRSYSTATAPSLARTIQLRQARKAVTDRLMRSKTVGSSLRHEHSVVENSNTLAGDIHMRDSDDEADAKTNKRRRAADGQAVVVTDDVEMEGSETAHKPRRHTKRVQGRRHGHAGHMNVDSGIKWQFSARLDAVSVSDVDSETDSDEDRDALASKVPLSKIGGGELIGLSLRPTTSSSSAPGPSGPAVAIRPTGFGSTRAPVPMFGEAEKPAAPVPAAVVSPAHVATPSASVVESPAPAPIVSAPASAISANLFGNIAALKPQPKDFAEPEKAVVPSTNNADTAASKAPLFGVSKPRDAAEGTSMPVFSFGKSTDTPTKDVNESAKPAEAPKTAEPAKPSNLFSFGKPSATSEPSKPAEGSDTPAIPAVSFSFGKPAASSEAEKPVPAAKIAPANMFSLGKPAANTSATASETEKPADADKPAATSSDFSFGFGKASATAVPSADAEKPASNFFSLGGSAVAVTSSAGDSAEQPKAVLKFGFGSLGASTAESGALKPADKGFSLSTSKPSENIFATPKPANNIFGSAKPADSAFGASKTPSLFGAAKPSENIFGSAKPSGNIFGSAKPAETATGTSDAKRSRSNSEAGSSLTDAATKSAFSFGSTTGGAFGAFKPDGGAGGDKDTTVVEDKPSTGFAFSKPLPAQGGSGFSFGGANASTSMTPPVKTIDLTTPSAPASNMFSGLGAKRPAFGNLGTQSPRVIKKPASLSALGRSTTASEDEPAAKKSAFTFGAVLNTPSAASFESTSVSTPAVPSFASNAPAFNGTPAATSSSFKFGLASSPAATPSTPVFSFGAKPSLQAGSSSFAGGSSFESTSRSASFGALNAPTGINFGSQPTGSFGQPNAASSSGFGQQQSTGFGQQSSTPSAFGQQYNAPSAFGQQSNTPSAFGQQPNAFTGFGQQANASSAFGQQPNTPSTFGQQGSTSFALGQQSNTSTGFGGGFGANTNNNSNSAFGAVPSPAPVTANTSQFNFNQNANTPAASSTGTFQFGSVNPGGFNPASRNVSGSNGVSSFQFTSNNSLQGGTPSASTFQFTAGVANPSNNGGMSTGRIGGSNTSTSSQGRRLARARPRRAH
ncbi:hypothetical protein LPJ66_003709 [Kickxella alabastrina]|uniref:Uncharacterized protein n=1 Tax=Kickxella alabastrina TaxID=61397 RepID=A0ACC1IJY4_9FUNG|nr:hypothetical protein LPJ66_003709 [Kickxella alabastrina]